MSTITVKTVKLGKPCGFCSTGGRHDLCPGGILNGNLTEVVTCGCTEHPIEYRCLLCNERDAREINPDTWQCIDPDRCSARQTKAREKALRDLFGTSDGQNPLRALPKSERPAKAPSKPKTGICLCCGETTGGGLFRPGHDSKYLTLWAFRVREGLEPLDRVLEHWSEQGISEALQGKLRKRVGA